MYFSRVAENATNALRIIRNLERESSVNTKRLSTGQRINEASDNPALWSVATKMKSQVSLTRTVADGLETTIGALDVAAKAIEKVQPLLDKFRNIMIAGQNATTDRQNLQTQLDDLKEQMLDIIRNASYNGVNLLYHKTGASYGLNFNSGIKGSGDSSLPINETLDTTSLALVDEVNSNGIMSKPYLYGNGTWRKFFNDYGGSGYRIGLYYASNVAATGYAYTAAMSSLGKIIDGVNDAGAQIGALKSRLVGQQSFLRTLATVQDTAIGRLVNADMAEEAARTKAIAARKDLAYEGLAIANSQHKLMLKLFEANPDNDILKTIHQ